MDDFEDYKATRSALHALEVSGADQVPSETCIGSWTASPPTCPSPPPPFFQDSMMKLTAAILHLGDVTFTGEDEAQVHPSGSEKLALVCELTGIPLPELVTALTSKASPPRLAGIAEPSPARQLVTLAPCSCCDRRWEEAGRR